MPSLGELAAHLAPLLDADRYAADGDPAGIWVASERPVRRLALRIEPGRAPYGWTDGLDAVLLHRPFGLWPARLPPDLGVLAYHRALDDELAIGSRAFASAMRLEVDDEPLRRDGTAIGLIGARDAPMPVSRMLGELAAAFGGWDEALNADDDRPVRRVALANAMTDALVRDAAARGAGLYLTGQVRGPARAAVAETGIAVVATGQSRAEAWGLREIGRQLARRWPELAIVDQTGVERSDAGSSDAGSSGG